MIRIKENKANVPFSVLDGERFSSQEDKNNLLLRKKVGRQFSFFHFIQPIRFWGLTHIDQSYGKQMYKSKSLYIILSVMQLPGELKYSCLLVNVLPSL